jgi:hypothetical protein
VTNYSSSQSDIIHGYHSPGSSTAQTVLDSESTPQRLVGDESGSDLSTNFCFGYEQEYQPKSAELWNGFREEDTSLKTAGVSPDKHYSVLPRIQAQAPSPKPWEKMKRWKFNDISGTSSWALNTDAAQISRIERPAATSSSNLRLVPSRDPNQPAHHGSFRVLPRPPDVVMVVSSPFVQTMLPVLTKSSTSRHT